MVLIADVYCTHSKVFFIMSADPCTDGVKIRLFSKKQTDREDCFVVCNERTFQKGCSTLYTCSLLCMTVSGDSCSDEVKSKPSSKKEDKGDDIISSLLCSLDDDINMDMMLGYVVRDCFYVAR